MANSFLEGILPFIYNMRKDQVGDDRFKPVPTPKPTPGPEPLPATFDLGLYGYVSGQDDTYAIHTSEVIAEVVPVLENLKNNYADMDISDISTITFQISKPGETLEGTIEEWKLSRIGSSENPNTLSLPVCEGRNITSSDYDLLAGVEITWSDSEIVIQLSRMS